jgi:hypothetical protein
MAKPYAGCEPHARGPAVGVLPRADEHLSPERWDIHPGVVMTIRQARLEDEPELRDIDAATWTADVSPAPPPSADTAFFGERTAPSDVLVAETGRVIAGYAALGQSSPLASHSHVLQIRGWRSTRPASAAGWGAGSWKPASSRLAAGARASCRCVFLVAMSRPVGSMSRAASRPRESCVRNSSSAGCMSTTF